VVTLESLTARPLDPAGALAGTGNVPPETLEEESDRLKAEVAALRKQAEVAALRAERDRLRADLIVYATAQVEAELSAGAAVEAGTPDRPAPAGGRAPAAKAAPAANRHRRSPATWAARAAMGLAGGVVALVLLLAVGPRFLPYQTFTVLTGSMEPVLPVGSIIVLVPAAAGELSVGDIITFQRPDRSDQMVTHRIVAIEDTPTGKAFVTKGDANNAPDGWRVPAAGNGWRAVMALPLLGYFFAVVQSPLGRLALLVVPALGLGIVTLFEIWRPVRPAAKLA
jgi:signal peptidase